MKRVTTVRRLSALALSLAPWVAGAQETPRHEPLVLLLPGSTRSAALGNSGVASRTMEAIWYNPALVGTQTGVAASAHRFGSASTLSTLSVVIPSTPVSMSFGLQSLDFWLDPVAFPRGDAPIGIRGDAVASSVAAAGAVAYRFKGFRWGLAGKYIEERRPGTRAGGGAFDLGVSRDVGVINLAFSAQNIGGGFTADDVPFRLPQRFTLGAEGGGYPIGAFIDVGAMASVSVLRGGFISPAAGVEMAYVPLDGWVFVGRVGARRPHERDIRQPITAGFTAGLDRFSIDYAFEGLEGEGVGHRFGVRIR